MTTAYRRWQASRPTLGEAHRDAMSRTQAVLSIIVILILWGIVGEMDYQDALRAEAEAKRPAATTATATATTTRR